VKRPKALVHRARSIATVGLLAACAPPGPPGPAPQASPIDTLALRAHTAYLASDLLEGRATGSRGGELAALYIEAQCRALGLRWVAASYRQNVALEEAVPRSDSTLLAVGDQRFMPGRDFLITGGTQAALRGFNGRPVFVGTPDDVRAAAARLPGLRGAIPVLAGAARGDVATLLAERGAAGIIQIIEDSSAYALHLASRGTSLTLLGAPDIPSSFYPDRPAVLVGPAAARSLAGAVRDPLARVELTVAFDRRPLRAANLACLLPGTDPRLGDSVIAFSAHYDHLGISVPDTTGDSLYNGFSDNAAGVAMLLSIAAAIRAGPGGGLHHPVLFLFFTGEERGLLGSDYFVARPLLPLERIRAVINLDAGAPPARPWTWRVAGGEGTPLGTLAADVAAARGWSATLSPATPNSDHFPFARRGVPAIFVIPGSAPYEGLTADSSQALRRRWDRYHQPADAYFDDFPFIGLQRYAEYALRIAEALDGGRYRFTPPSRREPGGIE
jgi:hypothetical protein